MSAPTTDNKVAGTVNKIIKAGENAAVDSVEALIVADVPALGFPVLKQLWQALFGWIAAYFVKIAETGVTFVVIDLQVGHEESKMSAALAALVAAEKTGNADEIKKAIAVYAEAQSALVHSDGSSTAV